MKPQRPQDSWQRKLPAKVKVILKMCPIKNGRKYKKDQIKPSSQRQASRENDL